MNRKNVTIAIFTSFVLLTCSDLTTARITQAIKYNHKKHIEAGLECADCHLNVEVGRRATIPALSQCMECHEEPLTESAEEEKIRTLSAEGTEYPWIQVTSLKPDVLFSHRRHVVDAQLECALCHGEMQVREQPPAKPAIKLTMKFCINCHKELAAETDCIACHR